MNGISLDEVRQTIALLFAPRHFYIGPGLKVVWQERVEEEIPWEIFQGRLLDARQTRQRARFEAWSVFCVEDSGLTSEPLLSVKLGADGQPLTEGARSASEGLKVHVARGLPCHVWEGYDAGSGNYLSRETTRWVRELVGTINLEPTTTLPEFREELRLLLHQAVVGTSRLPLTSVEAPLPAFTLGELAYCWREELPQPGGSPMTSHLELLAAGSRMRWVEKAKWLEAILRANPSAEIGALVEPFTAKWQALGHALAKIPTLLRMLFNDVSLSPWTDFVDKVLTFLEKLVETGKLHLHDQLDFHGYVLRQLARHLTAYDLVTFHYRGANYPDALLLDAVLKRYLLQAERHPVWFLPADTDSPADKWWKRLRRRALRQGWLRRRHYEGHPVPDQPTSPGENARVLPPPFTRVPEEQILMPHRRKRRLYDGDPLPAAPSSFVRAVLQESIKDLDDKAELRELGAAVFIDRPLGVLKPPVEPDQTILLAYEAFSPSVVERRLGELQCDTARLLSAERAAALARSVREHPLRGLPVRSLPDESRPVVSLADARKVADDFVIVRTLPSGVTEFLRQYDFRELRQRFQLDFLQPALPLLIVRGPVPSDSGMAVVQIYDQECRLRIELGIEAAGGYRRRYGVDYPANGLRVHRVWEQIGETELREHDLRAEALFVRPQH